MKLIKPEDSENLTEIPKHDKGTSLSQKDLNFKCYCPRNLYSLWKSST